MKEDQRKGLEVLSLLLLGGVALSSCGQPDHSTASSGASAFTPLERPEGQAFTINGVLFRIERPLKCTCLLESGTDEVPKNEIKVNEYAVTLEHGTLHLGQHRFEGLERGDEVALSLDGISVSGERRWDFPVN
jgi:hypothetical protein